MCEQLKEKLNCLILVFHVQIFYMFVKKINRSTERRGCLKMYSCKYVVRKVTFWLTFHKCTEEAEVSISDILSSDRHLRHACSNRMYLL